MKVNTMLGRTNQFRPIVRVYDAATLSELDKLLVAALNLVLEVGMGALLLIVLLVTSVSDQIDLVLTAKDASLLACVCVAGGSMVLGYSVARLAGLAPPQRRAVSLETGVQKMTALCVGTVATLTYRRFRSA